MTYRGWLLASLAGMLLLVALGGGAVFYARQPKRPNLLYGSFVGFRAPWETLGRDGWYLPPRENGMLLWTDAYCVPMDGGTAIWVPRPDGGVSIIPDDGTQNRLSWRAMLGEGVERMDIVPDGDAFVATLWPTETQQTWERVSLMKQRPRPCSDDADLEKPSPRRCFTRKDGIEFCASP
jgi:hypothetical protein